MAKIKKDSFVVKKYGGTSVADIGKIKFLATNIKKAFSNGERIIIVLSAMNKFTDEKIAMAKEVSANPDPRELDLVLHLGELESAGFLAMALIEIGVPAISLSAHQLGIESSDCFGNAKIKKIRKKDFLKKTAKDKVVIIPGFQGIIKESGDVTTLGRGGSDATAVAIAEAVKADVCEIYTDVDGVYTIDPRLVPNATRFAKINFMQMIAMAAAGAGVLMDRSVEIAQAHNVTIKVLLSPTFGQSTGGTIVSARGHGKNLEESFFLTGISIKKKVGLINITNIPNKPNEAVKIFEAINGINILDATQGKAGQKASISILLEGTDLDKTENKLKGLPDIKVQATNGLVSLSLIDPIMKDTSGYFYKITKALGEAEINIELISSGETSIVVTVKEEYLEKAANALAKEFNLIDSAT